ncbi:MAG: hypothetical protein KQH63_12480 [Desulfobulbaceae bacterium]|nr:hypothetical protein [Desulfobulbaceae bacterium]
MTMGKKVIKLPGKKNRAGLQVKNKAVRLRGVGVWVICILALLGSGGCSLFSAKQQGQYTESAGLQALDQYAWSCYERGMQYMDQSRFELAHQQFSFAASSAVSEALYKEALDGMRRAEQIIQVKR